MYCKKCGIELEDGTKYCKKCGEPVTLNCSNNITMPTVNEEKFSVEEKSKVKCPEFKIVDSSKISKDIKMQCPACGSERIHFGTNTSGSSYNTGDGCCGFILLGPIGLLCGTCGSDVKTEEFWVCQDCGNRFSNEDATQYRDKKIQNKVTSEQKKINDAKQAYNQYIQNLEEREKGLKIYGSLKTIEALRKKALNERDTKKQKYESEFEKFKTEIANSSNEEFRQCCKILDMKAKGKKSKKEKFCDAFIVIAILIAALGIFSGLIVPGIILGIIFLIPSFILLAKDMSKQEEAEEKIRNAFYKDYPEAESLLQESESAGERYRELDTLRNRINQCDTYEQQHKNN